MALLLFDIDGTLLKPVGLGRAAFEAALRETAGGEGEAGFAFDGLLDTQIAARALERRGIPASREAVGRLLEAYLTKLAAGAPPPGDLACPGVRSLLAAAAARGHHLALLTGNLGAGAAVKLSLASLDGFFRSNGPSSGLLGAFGGEAEERWELVPLALARCTEAFGRPFPSREVWVVGDSPRDVEAARRAGVRCAAVSSGLTPYERLAELGPDLLLHDLRDPLPLWNALEERP
jgi:phosphoglycolate phosphatase-like HAD superfamily hydrolase